MTTDLLSDLDVFHGDLTVNRAYVYARLPRPAEDAGLSLVGQVRGPRCKLAETLPVTSPLVDLGPGPTLLAQALLPDPVFWSPDLPAIYDVTVNLLRGTELIATARREIGLRSLGVRGRYLFLNGKRWVLRGVMTRLKIDERPHAWHDASAAYFTAAPNLEPLSEATECGALAVVGMLGTPNVLIRKLHQLAAHPAAAIAVVQGELPPDFLLSQVAPNLLLAQFLFFPRELATVQPWAHVLLVNAVDPQFVQQVAAQEERPIIAVRPLIPPLPVAEARAACDALQRDLAPLGQFAGYVV